MNGKLAGKTKTMSYALKKGRMMIVAGLNNE